MTIDVVPLRVMSLHALLYCERFFYLEEVEEICFADHAVNAVRRLPEEILPLDDGSPEQRSIEVAS
jgi:CRISPR-associated protein Cas1